MTSLIQIVFLLLGVLRFFILVHVIMSLLLHFGILNRSQPLIVQLWESLNKLLEPIYSRIRNFLPSTGVVDIAPLVALIGIEVIRIVLTNNFVSFT